VESVTKNDAEYRFTLQKNDQRTVLVYKLLTERVTEVPIGQWEELPPAQIRFSSTFFVPAQYTASLEKIYTEPSDGLSVAGTNRRIGAWSRWRGPMDGERSLTTFFCLQDSTEYPEFLKGTYYYNRIWKDLTLRPNRDTIRQLNTWDLREFIGRERKKWTGAFVGTMDEQLRFQGKWRDPAGGVQLNFSLEEEVLPFILEDWRKWRKTDNQRLDTLYYPRLTALANDTILSLFNDSLAQVERNRWLEISKKSLQPVKGDYAMLYANDRLLSLTFSVYQTGKKPIVEPLNFDYQTGDILTLETAYKTKDREFEARFVDLVQRLLESQQPAPKQLPLSLDDLKGTNFLFKNLRVLYFDPVSYYYYTVYVPYDRLKPFERNGFMEKYKLRDEEGVE
ncbi:MAG: hypothetical protein AAF740_11830, partial [Bacteroidota bacterium]